MTPQPFPFGEAPGLGGEDPVEAMLLAIQSGPLEAQPWGCFIALLRRALGARFTNLIFRRSDLRLVDNVAVHDGASVPDWLWPRYRAEFAGLDPIPYFTMQPGRVYAYAELDGVAEPGADRFREEFLRAADFEHLLIFRVTEPGGCNIWVTAARGAAAKPFDAADRALCARLARALQPALACHTALLNRETEAQIYRRIADLLSFGVITLESDGRVMAMDEAASRRIAETSELAVTKGRLHATHDDALLQRRIAGALAEGEAGTVHLGDADGLDLLVVPLPRRDDASPRAVHVMVYLSGRNGAGRDISSPLARLFALSDTQARLAMLLANGYRLSDAAGKIGITEQTARTYSKEIFQRTGTTRQGELIQRILTSVAMLS